MYIFIIIDDHYYYYQGWLTNVTTVTCQKLNIIQICGANYQMKYVDLLAGSTTPGDRDFGYIPYIFITVGNIIWTVSWIYVNQHKINFAESSIVRGFTLIPISYLMCRLYKSPTDFKNPQTFRVICKRATVIVIHTICFAISQYILPLPVVHTLNCSGSLFVFLIDYIMNGVQINKKQMVGISVGIFGAILVTNGRLITHLIDPSYHYESKFQNYITDDIVVMTLFSFVFLGAICCWSYGVVITKKANSNTFQINYTLGMALLFYGAISYPFAQPVATKTELFISVFTLGFPLIIGQCLYIGALTMTKNTGILNMMNFSAILVSYLISIFRYGQSPDLIAGFGVLLVFVGVYKTIFNKQAVKVDAKSLIQGVRKNQQK